MVLGGEECIIVLGVARLLYIVCIELARDGEVVCAGARSIVVVQVHVQFVVPVK